MEGEEGRRNAALRHGRGAGRLRLALPLVLMLLPLAQPFLGASNYGALSACGRPAFALHALRTSSFLPISRCAVLAPDLRATSSRTAAFPLPQLADRHRAARQGAAEVVCMARIPEGRLGYGWHLYPEPMPRRWGVNHVIISEEKTKRRKKILAEFSKKWCTYRGNRWPRATLKFLVEEVGMPSRYITPVWESGCNIRGLNVSSNLRPKVNYLTEEVGIPKSEIGKVVGRYPSILGLSTEGNLKPTVRFLEFVAGIPRDRLGESLSRYPTVLGLSIAGNLDPTLTFLREEAGIPPEMLSRLLAKSPQVLGHSVETSLRPTVTFLRKMGVPREEIGPILGKCPMLLTSSVSDNLAPKVLFFWTSLRIPRLAVAGMMSKYPSLLALNVANTIRPKIALLTDTLNVTPPTPSSLTAFHAIAGCDQELLPRAVN
ncbi:mTERF-domain-containing protein [Baffinella frigidus]|nr:mTERF-domain-containing protein [Cryptophyta sp. CCMP2293]